MKTSEKEKIFEYKGYTGIASWSEVDSLYHGKIQNIKDLIMYEGKDIEELELYFKEAVDEYIDELNQI